MMGRKKKKNTTVSSSLKVWCYYCDSEFDNESRLVYHQKAIHFNCHICYRQLFSAPAMAAHVLRFHQETVTKVPNAKPGRESTNIWIRGMQGIPPNILAAHVIEHIAEEVPSKLAEVDTPQLVGEVPEKLGIGHPPLSTQGPMQPINCSALPVPPAGSPLAPTMSPARKPLPGLKFERIMRLLESFNPTIRLHRGEIKEHFSKHSHTPDHPPYASMIQRAITELNEQEGSTEKTISRFIEEKYEDLPIAHATQLARHLQKLVTKGELVNTPGNCYMVSYENTDFLHNIKKGKKPSKRFEKNRKYSGKHNFKGFQSRKGQKLDNDQEQNQVQQKIFKRIEEEKQAKQNSRQIGELKNQEHVEMIGEQIEVEELQLEEVDERIEDEEDGEGHEEHDQIQEWQNQLQNELDILQSQALSKTIDVTTEENYQAEGSNQAAKNSEVTEAEHQNEQEDEVTKEQNEVEEVLLNVVEQIESEHDQMEELENPQQKELNLQQSQVPSETVGLTLEENYQEGSNLAEKNSEVTEADHQKTLEDLVAEEPYHKELESKNHEEKNHATNPESEVGDKEHQLPEIQLEEMVDEIGRERPRFEGSEELKKLQEQKMEVCSQIFDLRDMLLQLMKKETQVNATVSIQNKFNEPVADFSDSSHLKKEEFMELLKKTNKIGGKLNDIISSLNLQVSESNSPMPKIGGQQELVEVHLLQTENPCTGSDTVLACGFQHEQQQQVDICDQAKLAACQAKIISSANLRTDSMPPMGNLQVELSSQKRLPEVETTTLRDLFEKPNKQIKLCDQQETPKSQPTVMEISSDVPCDLPCEENGTVQLMIQEMETVVEDNAGTTELNIKFSGQTTISGQETDTSYLNTCMNSEQLKSSELFRLENLPEFQLVTGSVSVPLGSQNLEHWHQITFNGKGKRSEYMQPDNPIARRHGEHDQLQQMQLQPCTQMPSSSQLDIATSVGIQPDLKKQIYKMQLRHRGGRPAETKQVLPILEADPDPTLGSLKSEKMKKPLPSILKRTREQQRNHPHQQKRLKSEGTDITIVSAIIAPGSQVKQGQQQRLLMSQGEGSSQPDSVLLKRKEPSPFQPQQHGQPKLKSNVDHATGELTVYHELQGPKQSQHRGRGRPPKPKENSSASNHQNQNDKQAQYRQRGRPRKSKSATTLPPQHQLKN